MVDFSKVNAMKKQLEDRLSVGTKGNFARIEFWVPKAKKNNIRIMPSWTTDESSPFFGTFWREVHQHWKLSDDQRAPITCTKNTPGIETPCVVCDYVESLRADKSDLEKQELAKNIRAKVAYLMGVVDLDNPVYTKADVTAFMEKAKEGDEPPFKVGDPKIQVFAAGTQVFNQILAFLAENSKDLTHPTNGHDVTITKLGEGLTTKYEVMVKHKETPAPIKADTKLINLEEVGFVLENTKLLEIMNKGVGTIFPQLMPGSTQKALPSKAKSKAEQILEAAKSVDDDSDDLEAELADIVGKR